ncbi:YHS domain-containing (seleno)protein [Sandarakinorhabdus sp.]|uniref:YHS domain-containing (seleno)protein n=1 Tax=Sandarakinorhabdus sp. TaxID=1916663 RepID=UPI00286DF443|nr:YHS domain-containing (seleno)protein [Sandarakinorhabdus sp.]
MNIKTIIVAASIAIAAVAVPAAAKPAPVYTGTFSNLALSGYDPVAYFTQGKPVKGLKQFTTRYNGADWQFASAADLAAFKANPAKYAPQYGGHCAWAVSQGYTASGDPQVWKIVGDKLYVNYNAEVGEKWSKSIPDFIKSGNANWAKMSAK